MKNIKLIIEYKGSAFSGWQSQAEDKTIQDEIESAIQKVTSQKVNLTAAGRTDAGVHALGQTANFKIEHRLEPERFADAINYYLDDDIRIKNSEEVETGFNSRFDALSKRYRYCIGLEKSALYRDYRWEIEKPLAFEFLREAAEDINGEHDFAPFCVVSSRKESNLCRIDYSRWFRYGNLLTYEIRGNRFLHSMIRSLVGAMVNIAAEKSDRNSQNLTLSGFRDIIQTPTEERVKFTAPACGLYLVSVQY